MAPIGTTNASIAAFFWLFMFAVSLPPKWASLHLAGIALVISVGFAQRSDWRSPAVRTYLLCTALWMIPVLLTAVLQHALGVASATDWTKLLALVLRTFGIGLGIIVLVQRGWLSLYSATVALLCALAIHAGAGLIDWMTTSKTYLEETGRQFGVHGLVFNANPFGMFMAMAAILSVGLLRDQPRRAALWVLLFAAMFCVWVSESRGAILITAAGLAVLFPPNNRKRLLTYLGGGVLLASVYLYATLHSPLFYGASDSARMIALSFALEKIRMAPWIGWGIDAYEHFPDRVGPNAPHNMWLDLAVSSGLVAVAGALQSVALLATRLYRRRQPAAQMALAMFVAALVAGSLEYSILDSTHFRGLWVLVVALACCTLNERCGAHEATHRAESPVANLNQPFA